MGDLFVAVERLRWGDGHIEPGEPVPAGEAGRDYDGLLRYGHIARVAMEDIGDEAARRAIEALTTERDNLTARVAVLEAERDELAKQVEDLTAPAPPGEPLAEAGGDPPPPGPDALPDGVTDLGGGWFQLADNSKVRGRDALAAALGT